MGSPFFVANANATCNRSSKSPAIPCYNKKSYLEETKGAKNGIPEGFGTN